MTSDQLSVPWQTFKSESWSLFLLSVTDSDESQLLLFEEKHLKLVSNSNQKINWLGFLDCDFRISPQAESGPVYVCLWFYIDMFNKSLVHKILPAEHIISLTSSNYRGGRYGQKNIFWLFLFFLFSHNDEIRQKKSRKTLLAYQDIYW